MTQFISIEKPQRPAAELTGFALWQLGRRHGFLHGPAAHRRESTVARAFSGA